MAVYLALPRWQAEGPSSNESGEPDLISVLANISDEGFERPSSKWKLKLPEDHGAHATSRTETWQLVTHLENEDGAELGIQFSFLRLGIVPPTAPPPESIWEVRDLNRVHVTFLGAGLAAAIGEERFQRGIPKLSGYDADAGELRFDNWFLKFGSDPAGTTMTLYATIRDKAVVELVMRAQKPAVALEPDGVDAPFAGYSLTRLTVEGTVDQGQGEEAVTGTAWFDHLWGELPVPGAGPVAWDRVQLQLEDGTDISVVRSRRTDGRGAPAVNGVIFEPGGAVLSLDDGTFQMTASRTWRHPSTGAKYPIEWRIVGPELDISIGPLSDAQGHDFSAPLWSGLVQVRGNRAQTPVSGFGTLQLTGYTDR